MSSTQGSQSMISVTLATSGAAAGAAAPEVAKVTLIMDWLPWVLDIPVDVAQEKGFYADHGLTVKQTLPAGPTDVVKFVSTGKAQFGLYYAPDTLMGIGEGLSLIHISEPTRRTPISYAVFCLKKKNKKTSSTK